MYGIPYQAYKYNLIFLYDPLLIRNLWANKQVGIPTSQYKICSMTVGKCTLKRKSFFLMDMKYEPNGPIVLEKVPLTMKRRGGSLQSSAFLSK